MSGNVVGGRWSVVSAPAPNHHNAPGHVPPGNSRIVSLLPSATEIVCALELRSALVGRSHECDYPSSVASLPVCTSSLVDASGTSRQIHEGVSSILEHRDSVYDIDEALLRELKPTHIVTQIQCEVCAVSVEAVHQTVRSWEPAPSVISLRAVTLDQVFEDILRVAEALKVVDRGRELVAGLKARIAAIADAVPSHGKKVVGLEWIEPVMGTGNWMPELIAMAGGEDLFSTAGRHARWLRWEEVNASAWEEMIVFPCGFPMEKTEAELRTLNVPFHRALVADGNQFFNRPGPRLVETLEILAEMLHPGHFDFGHQGKRWRQWSRVGV